MVLSLKPAAKRLTQTTTKERLTLEEARKIENWSERIFAIAVCSIPHLEVYHEPNRIGNQSGVTEPDFLIINTKRGWDASHVYIEVTGSKDLNGHRKKKQSRVMNRFVSGHEKTKYFQFKREVIEKISTYKGIEKVLSVAKRLARDYPPRTQLSAEGAARLAYRVRHRSRDIR